MSTLEVKLAIVRFTEKANKMVRSIHQICLPLSIFNLSY